MTESSDLAYPAFRAWCDKARRLGLTFGQSPYTLLQMAFEAGYEARKTAEVPPEAPWDELTAIFPPDYSLPGKSDAIRDEIKWIFAPPPPFAGRTDPGYELKEPGLTDEDVRNVKDSLAPGPGPGMTAAQEAYDRHFGAPGPVPAIPGLNGEPGEDEPYDDEEF